MHNPIVPAAVRYIKLGTGGIWEQECIEKGTIRLGFGTEKPARFELCSKGRWNKLKSSFRKQYKKRAARHANEVSRFFEDDGSTLWITFYDGLLYWCFLDPQSKAKRHSDGEGVYRCTTKEGWRSKDLNREPLQQSNLPKKLTKLAKYKGTSCTPKAADYVLQRINCSEEAFQATPAAADLAKPPPRVKSTIYRVIRDTKLAKQVKALHNYECQLCGKWIDLPDDSRYAEAHHIRPLGRPHKGYDTMDNIVCVCPTCHAKLDYGACELVAKELTPIPGHSINEKYIDYHNKKIYGQETK